MSKPKFDIQSENLDLYFAHEIMKMSDGQRNKVPSQLLYRVITRTGKYSHIGASRMSIIAKLIILVKGLNKNVFIVIEDEDGESIEDFSKLKKEIKGRKINQENVNMLCGTYVAGGKELIDTLSYMDEVTSSPLYNYLNKIKNVPKNKVEKWGDEMTYIMNFLAKYEGGKKKWMSETGLNIQEFMILIALYHGNEVQSLGIIRETYKHSLYAGSTRMKMAFSTLQTKGLVIKHGVSKAAKMRITPIGKDLLNRIMIKIV